MRTLLTKDERAAVLLKIEQLYAEHGRWANEPQPWTNSITSYNRFQEYQQSHCLQINYHGEDTPLKSCCGDYGARFDSSKERNEWHELRRLQNIYDHAKATMEWAAQQIQSVTN